MVAEEGGSKGAYEGAEGQMQREPVFLQVGAPWRMEPAFAASDLPRSDRVELAPVMTTSAPLL